MKMVLGTVLSELSVVALFVIAFNYGRRMSVSHVQCSAAIGIFFLAVSFYESAGWVQLSP